jgi:hypothetical protein
MTARAPIFAGHRLDALIDHWLKGHLRTECPDLWMLTLSAAERTTPFVWVAHDGNHIQKTSPQARRLRTAGLPWPQNRLELPCG